MRRGEVMAELAALLLLAAAGAGCRSQGIVLYNTVGDQRVYPYFIDQPMVLAFWNASNIQSIDDLPALNTLDKREGPVHVLGVATGDRLDMNKWMRRMGVAFEVVYDPDERLARRLGISSYPTYVYFDHAGAEIDRSLTVRTIQNWFDRRRWLEKSTGRERKSPLPAPSPAPEVPASPETPEASESRTPVARQATSG